MSERSYSYDLDGRGSHVPVFVVELRRRWWLGAWDAHIDAPSGVIHARYPATWPRSRAVATSRRLAEQFAESHHHLVGVVDEWTAVLT